MAVRVVGLGPGVPDAETHRLGMTLPLAPASVSPSASASASESRPGLVSSAGAGDLVGVPGTMRAKVTPFTACVDGSSYPVQSGYPFVSDADVTLTFPDGEPALPRVDRVIARVRDDVYDASGLRQGSIEVLKGQPSGAPARLPPSSLLLWEVTVPAGASVGAGGLDITAVRVDRRTYTTALGGVQYVRDDADQAQVAPYPGLTVFSAAMGRLDVWDGTRYRNLSPIRVASLAGRPAAPYAGQEIWRDDRRLIQIWDGSGWRDHPSTTVFVRKSTDQSVTKSNAWVSAADLRLSARAGVTYELSGVLFYSAHQDGNIKIGWTGPSGAWADWIVHATVPANTGTSGPVILDRQFLNTYPYLGGADATNDVQMGAAFQGLYHGGTGGTLQLWFSQATAHTTASIMRAGSYVTLRQIP